MNPIYKFYQSRLNAVFSELDEVAKPGGIVFLGDSITDFFRLNEFFHGIYIINRGISSDTTTGVLSRLRDSVFDLSPSKVFIMIGTNDLGDHVPQENIVGNIGEIITRIQQKCPQAKLYLESVYPVSLEKSKKIRKFIVGKRNNEKICRINEQLIKLAADKGITYIDVYSHLIDENENIRLEYTVEGLHLTVQGYKVVARVLWPYVTE